jgi:hypothetical protein
MSRLRRSLLPLLGMGGALALGGCVDMFTSVPSSDASHWRGVTTAGVAGKPECAPFAVDVGVEADPLFMWQVVGGRARPTADAVATFGQTDFALSQWWLEGFMTPANFVQLESRLQRPVILGARPYAVWRGTRDDERIVLVESGSPCGREVVLTRG